MKQTDLSIYNKRISKWLELCIVLFAPLLSVIDVFIINMAIPSIKKGVHATDAGIQLVIAGYLLGYAAFLITGGRAGDHFGRKKVFIYGMLFFTITSCFAGMSQTIFQLNAMRILQGISAAFMVPQTIAYIQTIFKGKKERAKAIGYFGITLGIAGVIGQFLGGYLSDLDFVIAGWRLIFFINLPIGILAIWLSNKYLEQVPTNTFNRFDYSGVIILTAGLIFLIYPLIQGREAGWPAWSFAMMITSFLIFSFFIKHQQKKLKRQKEPLINVQLFKIKDFNIGLLAVLFYFMMHTSFLLIASVYFQNGLHASAFDCGLYFVAMGLSFIISSVLSIRYVARYGKVVLQFGVALIILTFISQIFLFSGKFNSAWIYLLMGFFGFGGGLVLPSLLNMALKSVPTVFAGAAAGVYSTFQQTASALGICITGGVFYFVLGSGTATLYYQKAFDYATTFNIVLLCIVGFLLYLLPDKKVQVDVAIND